jgi:hypothetical protein
VQEAATRDRFVHLHFRAQMQGELNESGSEAKPAALTSHDEGPGSRGVGGAHDCVDGQSTCHLIRSSDPLEPRFESTGGIGAASQGINVQSIWRGCLRLPRPP